MTTPDNTSSTSELSNVGAYKLEAAALLKLTWPMLIAQLAQMGTGRGRYYNGWAL